MHLNMSIGCLLKAQVGNLCSVWFMLMGGSCIVFEGFLLARGSSLSSYCAIPVDQAHTQEGYSSFLGNSNYPYITMRPLLLFTTQNTSTQYDLDTSTVLEPLGQCNQFRITHDLNSIHAATSSDPDKRKNPKKKKHPH